MSEELDPNEALIAKVMKANETAEEGNEPEPTRRRRKKKVSKKAASSKIQASKEAAKQLAQALVKKKTEEKEAEKRDPNMVYYMACPVEHPGIFFVNSPDGALTPDNWYSMTKEPDHPWPSNIIPCQICGKTMRVWYTPEGTMIPNRRFLRKLKLEEFESKMREVTSDVTG